jgi:omega-amidase
VDNQIYVSMCSPARDMTADYHSVSLEGPTSEETLIKLHQSVGPLECYRPNVCRIFAGVALPDLLRRGKVIATTEHDEAIIYADIDPQVIVEARTWIPVTTQRRFDVYPDVATA